MSNNFHLQLYRGTTAQNNAYTGPAGEITMDTSTNKLRLHDGSTAGGIEIGGMPVGSIIPYAGSTAPTGYLLCDGSAISRSTYSSLFSVIGTTYGPGDGNTTFNLPVTSRYLIEKQEVSSNDSRWYNLYSDGWCEQGGKVSSASTVTLLKEYKNTDYTSLSSTIRNNSASSDEGCASVYVKSTTQIYVSAGAYMYGVYWYTCGYCSISLNKKDIIKY